MFCQTKLESFDDYDALDKAIYAEVDPYSMRHSIKTPQHSSMVGLSIVTVGGLRLGKLTVMLRPARLQTPPLKLLTLSTDWARASRSYTKTLSNRAAQYLAMP
ncbi:uncharacterized protein LOC119634912 [Glossina fuscipes]|uniref:Uncharacterized protein LOC119634912 n=1 Tax=Glossina fuscipes TaxID=7396 RepID=A0A8U0WJZ5_9MUSC|nr:uncharacterized protein LOC119634912 [Glossina fuscipes]XP_037885270.1 uncharacterized protein LOC119634912 [Glossina fuscipes]